MRDFIVEQQADCPQVEPDCLPEDSKSLGVVDAKVHAMILIKLDLPSALQSTGVGIVEFLGSLFSGVVEANGRDPASNGEAD